MTKQTADCSLHLTWITKNSISVFQLNE